MARGVARLQYRCYCTGAVLKSIYHQIASNGMHVFFLRGNQDALPRYLHTHDTSARSSSSEERNIRQQCPTLAPTQDLTAGDASARPAIGVVHAVLGLLRAERPSMASST
jgi:hypothetical protein